MDEATSNVDLRVQAVSSEVHLPLVLLALLRGHPASRHVPWSDGTPHLLHRIAESGECLVLQRSAVRTMGAV